MYVSLGYVGIPICTCVWRSDIGIFDDSSALFFETTDFLTPSGAQHWGKASWLMSSGDMAVSTSLLSSSHEGYRPATHAWHLHGAGPLHSDPHARTTDCLLTDPSPQPHGLVF